jgi:hypothetical protein
MSADHTPRLITHQRKNQIVVFERRMGIAPLHLPISSDAEAMLSIRREVGRFKQSPMTRPADRVDGCGATGQAGCHLLRLHMSGFMMSVAVNFAVVIILFVAAVLMTIGMLGMR